MIGELFNYYKLDENNVVTRCKTIEEFAIYFESKQRYLCKNSLGDIWVSTVFLGIDHSFDVNDAPIVFESMVFNKDNDLDQERYSTYADAIQGHIALCKKYGIYYTKSSEEKTINDFKDLE